MISSVVCICGSLCLKYRKSYVDLELETTLPGSKQLNRTNLVLQSVKILGNNEDNEEVNDIGETENNVNQNKTLSQDTDFKSIPFVQNIDVAQFKGMAESEYEWLKTMCIDNPLNPYRNLYKKKLERIGAGGIITSKHMEEIFKSARKISYTGALISLIAFFIIVPAVALGQTVLSKVELATWISVCQHWCLIGTILVVTIPPIQECLQIWRQYKQNKTTSK